ncbi:conserved hypothetical protein [Rhodobacteraceae bacterium KLH11]|nr:conserved hypothetical protein [Rhodobacteraceae bacterium KLH11]
MKQLINATSTPLASIFGSGFLIIVPILAGVVGSYAIFAILAVTILAYAVGSVVRYNIRVAEPALEAGTASHHTEVFERGSDVALVLAYVISVLLYIKILASFFLGGVENVIPGINTPMVSHILVSMVIASIAFVGYFHGLSLLQRLENVALWVTLVIIVALLAGFSSYGLAAYQGQGIVWPETPDKSLWEITTVVAGTLIVVQGFETSRYLGREFDTETRIRSSRLSQIISMVVYIAFIALATPLMHTLDGKVETDSLIKLAGEASGLLIVPLILAAVLSQFSAAVADTMGGGGNLTEVSKQHVSTRCAYVIICGGAIALALAPTLTILALASRAFAFYYMMQCFVAMSVNDSKNQRIAIGAVAAVLAFIMIFAVPAG